MAELLLFVGDNATDPARYRDGDVVCAFNQRRIRACHAEAICHPVAAGFNADGLRPDGLSRQWHELTHQYRFERVGPAAVLRTDLTTGAADVLGLRPNARGEAIDVALFIDRRTAHPAHRVYGAKGREVWYGGRIDQSDATLAKVWARIEGGSALREADHRDWPLTDAEKTNFLSVPTEDFDEATRADYESEETAPDGAIVKKRAHFVAYDDVPAIAARVPKGLRKKLQSLDIRKLVAAQKLAQIVNKR